MTALVDRQRLARVCGLLGSEHDVEALAAARQTEKVRKKLGLTWEELLVPPTRQRPADPPPEELTDWRSACHFCLERYWSLTSWELDFVATVARHTKPPSAKQLIVLRRLLARCRKAARLMATIMYTVRASCYAGTAALTGHIVQRFSLGGAATQISPRGSRSRNPRR